MKWILILDNGLMHSDHNHYTVAVCHTKIDADGALLLWKTWKESAPAIGNEWTFEKSEAVRKWCSENPPPFDFPEDDDDADPECYAHDPLKYILTAIEVPEWADK